MHNAGVRVIGSAPAGACISAQVVDYWKEPRQGHVAVTALPMTAAHVEKKRISESLTKLSGGIT